jgi:hypothetical protein
LALTEKAPKLPDVLRCTTPAPPILGVLLIDVRTQATPRSRIGSPPSLVTSLPSTAETPVMPDDVGDHTLGELVLAVKFPTVL